MLRAEPFRRPLLGNYTTDRGTIAAEIAAAERGGLDFFDVLW